MKVINPEELIVRSIKIEDVRLLKEFDCNNPSMNSFLKREAYFADISREASTSLVFLNDELVGYYTLTREKLNIEGLSEDEVGHNTTLEIARLAIAKDKQGLGIGSYIIKSIIDNAYAFNDRFITIESIYEYWEWYYRIGFDYLIEEEINESNPSTVVSMLLDLFDEEVVNEYLEVS
ncbi:GNAT family N-acetyltransferase [Halobacillus sp. K22]|uniref:GNAT family N-acetyltransferase n=1 Tax=Halobacillus sp. K22 TaxID=3457431 RepID=UPI003FCCF8C4